MGRIMMGDEENEEEAGEVEPTPVPLLLLLLLLLPPLLTTPSEVGDVLFVGEEMDLGADNDDGDDTLLLLFT